MDRQEAGNATHAPVETPSRSASAEPCHDARVLTGGGPSARILLGDQVYALRITKAGKLILTK
jgi:hemin uptake protein HemP